MRTHFYPEGGWGWLVCAAGFLALLLTTGMQLAFGLLHVHAVRRFGEEHLMDLGKFSSTYIYVYILTLSPSNDISSLSSLLLPPDSDNSREGTLPCSVGNFLPKKLPSFGKSFFKLCLLCSRVFALLLTIYEPSPPRARGEKAFGSRCTEMEFFGGSFLRLGILIRENK